ncbi:MAG: ribosome small subunit-dependent GTPase A [Clostridiales bacterium]|nr:ribosome small subunit-dependent GTPase A [Clostridiales bacterium]
MTVSGKIIKGIGGFYYVDAQDGNVYECKAKGIFRNKKIKPLVGDNVHIEILDTDNNLGNIIEILPRFNSLIRPAVANVDQTIIIFAVNEPEPNFNLLDRFLVNMEKSCVKTIICFNKNDLSGDYTDACESYRKSGYETLFISAREQKGLQELRNIIKGKTTVFAGPSGVGKSSTLNAIKPDAEAQTGEISEKIKRGRHTTRHSELMHVEGNTYIMDTPGFSSLHVEGIEPQDLKEYFPDIAVYTGKCRFNMCNHVSEPDCLVKNAVECGDISRIRYDDYVMIYNDLKEKRKW